MKTIELLKENSFISELLNGPCAPKDDKSDCAPINPAWIDQEMSEIITTAFHKLLPSDMPYLTYVLVERNPDSMYEGTCVDADEKRMRYFVISVIPDTEYPYDCSFPMIHQMWTLSLHCWEVIRATLAACTMDMRFRIATNPVPPILNNAKIEWVSLYLGRNPYRGISKLSEQWSCPEEYDGIEFDVHLYKIREMDTTPLLQRLVEAFDSDFPMPEGEDIKGQG